MKNKTKLKQLLLLLLIFTFSATITFGQNCGDINSDGSTNIVDALLIAQCYVSLISCPSADIGDVNCDGQVNIVDALLIAQLYVGLISTLDCCGETPPPIPQPVEETVFAVNCGGNAYTSSDDTVYAADTGFSGGTGYDNGASVSGTSDPTLYSTERYGSCTYSASVPNGDYMVTLHFAENYHTQTGMRSFNVVIEGTGVISNLDIYAEAGGGNAAYVTENQVSVSDGEINIEFVTVNENALINAIKVDAISFTGEPIVKFTVSPSNPKPGETVTVDASDSYDPDGSITNYQVNYGDGQTGNGAVTTHQYAEGDYTITVTVTDNDSKTTSLSKSIMVRDISVNKLKPRVVVLTDISTWEHDDHESMTRFLAHADLFEIEAIMLTTGYSYDNADEGTQMGILNGIINAYESDLPNLMKRSGQSGFAHDNGQQEVGYWPSANYVRDHSMMGSLNKYQSSIGSSNRNGGSDYLIELALENDERPVWITVWGGANTVCQMVWQIEQDRPQDKARILQKLRLYTITDQDKHYANGGDTCHDNMEPKVANDLLYVDDECAWTRHNSTGKSNWSQYQTHIQGHGNLGRQYPKYDYGVEGDTPSFLYCMPNGLNNPDDPNQCSWGGTYRHSGNNKWDPAGSCGEYFNRFYPAAFNNFAARMDWAANGSGNRNPVIKIDGDDGYRVMERTPRQGTTLTLDASETYDPDGNNLTFNWWVQDDIGSGDISIGNSSSSIATINVPSGSAGRTYHVICEVKDNGTHNLSSYRRILIKPTN